MIQEAPILAPRKPHAIESFKPEYKKVYIPEAERDLLTQMKLEINPPHTNRILAKWEIEQALPQKEKFGSTFDYVDYFFRDIIGDGGRMPIHYVKKSGKVESERIPQNTVEYRYAYENNQKLIYLVRKIIEKSRSKEILDRFYNKIHDYSGGMFIEPPPIGNWDISNVKDKTIIDKILLMDAYINYYRGNTGEQPDRKKYEDMEMLRNELYNGDMTNLDFITKELNKFIELLEPKPVKQQEITIDEPQPLRSIKYDKFGYDPEWKKEIYELYHSKKRTNSQKFKYTQYLLKKLQTEYDLYPTPEILTKTIIDDFMKYNNKNDVYNILEPSLGLGSLLFPFIDRQHEISINKIDGIEYSKKLFNLMSNKINISNKYQDDFLEFKQERPYNLILMNPPYRGYVKLTDRSVKEAEYYWFHIIKALLLDFANYDKTIYLICPKIHNKLNSDNTFEPSINNSLEKRIKEYFNIDKDENIFNVNGITQFTFLRDSTKEFDSFDERGRPVKLGLTVCLYKIVQCCSNDKIEMEYNMDMLFFLNQRNILKKKLIEMPGDKVKDKILTTSTKRSLTNLLQDMDDYIDTTYRPREDKEKMEKLKDKLLNADNTKINDIIDIIFARLRYFKGIFGSGKNKKRKN